jgi:hypothetical protein
MCSFLITPNGGFDGGSRFDERQPMAAAAVENDWMCIVMPSDVGDPQNGDAVIAGFDDLVKTGLDPHTAAVKENGAVGRSRHCDSREAIARLR